MILNDKNVWMYQSAAKIFLICKEKEDMSPTNTMAAHIGTNLDV